MGGGNGGPALAPTHELHFVSLHQPGRSIVVPCDAAGHVDLDLLSERMRLSYLGARATLGREYGYPTITPAH
jgi:hypothetical protein